MKLIPICAFGKPSEIGAVGVSSLKVMTVKNLRIPTIGRSQAAPSVARALRNTYGAKPVRICGRDISAVDKVFGDDWLD